MIGNGKDSYCDNEIKGFDTLCHCLYVVIIHAYDLMNMSWTVFICHFCSLVMEQIYMDYTDVPFTYGLLGFRSALIVVLSNVFVIL